MPELPEVETIVNELKEHIIGRQIKNVELKGISISKEPFDVFSAQIKNKFIENITRHGKAIFIHLRNGVLGKKDSSSPLVLRVHLGMTGQLLFVHPEKSVAKHTHFIFNFDSRIVQLRYVDIRRFGEMELISAKEMASDVPDAWMAPEETLFSTLKLKTGIVKHALLNQNILAGLGNIYVDESLYRAKIHPRKTLSSLKTEKLKILCRSIKDVLAESIKLGGTSFRNYVDINGSKGGYKGRLSVYGKEGEPCDCGKTIKKMIVAGRGTHFCPGCQPVPR